jgi:hypothetical protein
MVDEMLNRPRHLDLIQEMEQHLVEKPEDWETRKDQVARLAKTARSQAKESQQLVLRALVERIAEDEVDDVRQEAIQGIYGIWDANWTTRRQTIIDQIQELRAHPNCEVRKASVDWLKANAGGIARENLFLSLALEILIQMAREDEDASVKRTAWEACQKIWEAGSTAKEAQEVYKTDVFLHFLSVLKEGRKGEEAWDLRRAVAEWLGENAQAITNDERMAEDALETLIAQSRPEESGSVERSAYKAIQKIWNEGWKSQAKSESWWMGIRKLWDGSWKIPGEQENRRVAILNQVGRTLARGEKGLRQTAIEWLGEKAVDIVGDEGMLEKTLDFLIERASQDPDENVRRSAESAFRKILSWGWHTSLGQNTRKQIILNRTMEALQMEAKGGIEARKAAADWLEDVAEDLAEEDRMADRILNILIRSVKDSQEVDRLKILNAIQKIWEVGWKNAGDFSQQKQVVLGQVLKGFESEGYEFSVIHRVTADWLGENARSIAEDEAMVNKTLNSLFPRTCIDEKEDVRESAQEASRRLWNAAWEVFEPSTGGRGFSRSSGTGNRERVAAYKLILVNQVLKVLDKSDNREFKQMAAYWLGDKATGLASSERIVSDTLKTLSRWLDEDREPDLMRASREAVKKIWNAGVKTQRKAVFEGILKYLEDQRDGWEKWEFRQIAINWVGDKAEDLVVDFDLSERIANFLDDLRKDPYPYKELKDSATRTLVALWDALKHAYKLEDIKKNFDSLDYDEKVRTMRRLADENTLGSREAVSFLVKKWIEWIREEEEKPLVELTAEAIRYNDHAVLPLVEHFVKSREAPTGQPRPRAPQSANGSTNGGFSDGQETKVSKKTLVRQRIARQLADMSDPRFFNTPDKSGKYESIDQELSNHAVPALIRELPDEKDIEIMENMARTLLHTREREAIDAVAKEVVGQERTHKARKELLGEYYLEPSKASSDQASEILKQAINASKRTLWLLQGLNMLVLAVGLAVVFFGVWLSLTSETMASQFAGIIATVGGFGGIVVQLIQNPINRIQKAISNLVQMDTAFTSFIWELNLNSTFIQSSYVADGDLTEGEISNTSERIEKAMQSTMNLVSIFTEEGKQRLVTRIDKLDPPAGNLASPITIHGQHLLGDRGHRKKINQAAVAANQALDKAGIPAALDSKEPGGMVAVNHIPVEVRDLSWQEKAVRFTLSEDFLGGNSSNGILMISLFIDGVETNALPFHIT